MQLAQACHGVAEFAATRHGPFNRWITGCNYIVILAVPDEPQLLEWAGRLDGTLVFEPDIDEHTAFVATPGDQHVLLAQLPLAGRELAMT